jgi:hypothetical protein
MIPIQDELLHLFEQMDDQQRNHLLNLARQLVQPPPHYTARELLALPKEERERLVAQSIALATDEDFEIFEAYSEENIDDD